MYKLESKQEINAGIEELWEFISTPRNLNVITPPDMSFEIQSEVPDKMYNGLIVEYLVKIPVVGKRKWISEIKHIREGISFVDEQREGPYKTWYHYHELEKISDTKTMMTDRIYYRVPFGPAGKAARALFVKRTLDKIFAFRKKKMEDLYGG